MAIFREKNPINRFDSGLVQMSKQEIILMIIVGLAIVLAIFFMAGPQLIYPAELHGHFLIGYVAEDGDFCTDLCLSYEFWRIVLQGGIETRMEREPGSPIFFNPYLNTYYIDCRVKLTEHLYIGGSHECEHTVISFPEQFYEPFSSRMKTTFYAGIWW